MPYLRDFADNSIMKENLGKKIRVQLKIAQKRDGCQTEWMNEWMGYEIVGTNFSICDNMGPVIWH